MDRSCRKWGTAVPGRALTSGDLIGRILALRTFPGFLGLDPSDLATMAEVSELNWFARGDEMIAPGRPVTHIHMLLEGAVDILKDGEVARRLEARGAVGGLAALAGSEQGQHVVAAEPTLSLMLAVEDMFDVFEDNFRLASAVLKAMTREMLNTRRSLQGGPGYNPPEPGPPASEVPELGLVEKMMWTHRALPFGKDFIEAIAELSSAAQEVRVKSGTVLWKASDPSDDYFGIVSGVLAGVTNEGQAFRFGSKSMVGILDALSSSPRWYTATAETDLVMIRFEPRVYFEILEDHTDMALEAMRFVATALLQMLDQVAQRKLASQRPAAAE